MSRRGTKRKQQPTGGGDTGTAPAPVPAKLPSDDAARPAAGGTTPRSDGARGDPVPGAECTRSSEHSNQAPAEDNSATHTAASDDESNSGQGLAAPRVGNVRLGRAFFDQPCEDLAKALLGQRLVRLVDGVRLSAVIVETEAYLGTADKAAHSYRGQTDRNKAMFMQPGTAYVYNIYGVYCCLNISSQGEGAAVLIRGVEPQEGVDKMLELRAGRSRSKSAAKKRPLLPRDLGNGPSKLCQSLAVSKPEVNQRDLVTDAGTWLEEGEAVGAAGPGRGQTAVVVARRVNIAYAEEWTEMPLRFYVRGNKCVSVRDKEAEKAQQDAASQASESPYFSASLMEGDKVGLAEPV